MKNKTNSALVVRNNLLSKMISFENMAILKSEVEVSEMNKLYQELEEHVMIIKSETLELDYKLSLILEDIKKKKTCLEDTKAKKVYIIPERDNLIKEYLIDTIKLIKIYRSLNVNTIEEMIEKFNKEKNNYLSNYSQFNNLNKDIVDLNIILTTYEKDLQKMEISLKSKDFDEILSGNYKSDLEVSNMEIILKENKDTVDESIDKIAKFGEIIIKIKRDFLKFENILNNTIRFIRDLNIMRMKDKDNIKTSNSQGKKNEINGSLAALKDKNKILNTEYSMKFSVEINSIPNDSEWSNSQGNLNKIITLKFIFLKNNVKFY
jgi:hypothetical protein